MLAHFENLVDPGGLMAPAERAKLAHNARQTQMAQARLKSLQRARERREARAAEQKR